MIPSLLIALAWLLFGGTHLIMSESTLQQSMSKKYGSLSFTLLFLVTTLMTMVVLIVTLSIYGNQGVSGLAVGNIYTQSILKAISLLGTFLIIAGLMSYPTSLIAALAQRRFVQRKSLKSPHGVTLITRHPFFVGLGTLSLGHIFLANTLANATFFGALLLVCIIGTRLQDSKLRRRWPDVYPNYEGQTSILPFAKICRSHHKLTITTGLSWVIGGTFSWIIFGYFHAFWAYANGAMFLVIILLYGIAGVSLGVLLNRKGKS